MENVITKIDLVMWTKNSGRTLFPVLYQINRFVPEACVNKKFIVDDGSTDDTREIAERLGWSVIQNEGSGISDGANTALRHVESEFFASFEHDLLLNREWWNRISSAFADSKVAVASGIRLPIQPVFLRKLQQYTFERYSGKTHSLYAKTLDNTLYRTEQIRKLGGFPKLSINPGVDNALAKKLLANGKVWRVDFSVCSDHLRYGFVDELKHYWWYGKNYVNLRKTLGVSIDSVASVLLRTLFSPMRAVQVALLKYDWRIVFAYPVIRATILLGMFHSFMKVLFA